MKVTLALSSEMAGFWKSKQGSFFFIKKKITFPTLYEAEFC